MKTITSLPPAAALTGAEKLPADQAGATVGVSAAQLQTLAQAGMASASDLQAKADATALAAAAAQIEQAQGTANDALGDAATAQQKADLAQDTADQAVAALDTKADLVDGTVPLMQLPPFIPTVAQTVADISTVTASGFYRTEAGAGHNAPNSESTWFYQVMWHNASQCVILAWRESNPRLMYSRYKINGSWVAWEKQNSWQTLQDRPIMPADHELARIINYSTQYIDTLGGLQLNASSVATGSNNVLVVGVEVSIWHLDTMTDSNGQQTEVWALYGPGLSGDKFNYNTPPSLVNLYLQTPNQLITYNEQPVGTYGLFSGDLADQPGISWQNGGPNAASILFYRDGYGALSYYQSYFGNYASIRLVMGFPDSALANWPIFDFGKWVIAGNNNIILMDLNRYQVNSGWHFYSDWGVLTGDGNLVKLMIYCPSSGMQGSGLLQHFKVTDNFNTHQLTGGTIIPV
ncbi:MAG: pyocin knob domain-containing protein [Verrucomicrobiales bacterium]|nr:pyocin knob domain-containing protein [Verrucomicrobiales bacterium]